LAGARGLPGGAWKRRNAMKMNASTADRTRLSVARSVDQGPLWREVWNSRSILWLLTRRELRARYAGSMLGVAWNVIHPVVMIAIFIVILGSFMPAKLGTAGGRGSYALFLCAGMIPWLVFREIVTRCASTLLENAGLIKKVAFPEVVLHLSVLINAVAIHAVSYLAFMVILVGAGQWPGARAVAAFALLVAVGLFALGIGLMVSVLNIYFRDVGQLVEIVLQFVFWFTPIVYFPSLLRGGSSPFVRFVAALLDWNPLVHFVRLSQWLFRAPESSFSWVSLAVVGLAPIGVLAAGLLFFGHFKRDLLDNI
jgi:lipopolysaccharide transport system permease protein